MQAEWKKEKWFIAEHVIFAEGEGDYIGEKSLKGNSSWFEEAENLTQNGLANI